MFGWFAFVRGITVPLLGLVDLGFHELGHLLTYPFPDVVTAMMGSVTQVTVPLGIALYFLLLRRERLGGGLCLAWAATSAQNVSVYIADAPVQTLPLLGEGMHDWAFVLGRFDAIDSAATIAAIVKGFGLVLLFAGFAVCVWSLLIDDAATRGGGGTSRFGTLTLNAPPRRLPPSTSGPVVDSPTGRDSLRYVLVITEL